MTADPSKSKLRETWETAAPGWAKWEQVISDALADATEVLIDMAAIRPGMRVLDVACGAGSQTFRLAARVGPEGHVVASDISRTMLDHVQQRAAQEGLQNIETLESAADDLSETLSPFDAAISRLGLMLFPSPATALQAVKRTLKPDARFGALVFTTPNKNPYMARPMSILLRHAGKSPPRPGQPGIFALGDERVLERLMTDAGFSDVQTGKMQSSLKLASAADALAMMQQAFGAYRAVVADLSEERRADAWNEVFLSLQELEVDGEFRTELEFVTASGARPR